MDKLLSCSTKESPSQNVTYIDATEEDVPFLLSVILHAYAEFWGKLNPHSGAFAETAETIADKLQKGGAIKALCDGEIVGTFLYEQRPEFMYFGRLAVLPQWRRLGIAKELIRAVEERTRGVGLQRVQIGVRLVLASHQDYYMALGYQPINYECHPGFTEPTSVTMAKIL